MEMARLTIVKMAPLGHNPFDTIPFYVDEEDDPGAVSPATTKLGPIESLPEFQDELKEKGLHLGQNPYGEWKFGTIVSDLPTVNPISIPKEESSFYEADDPYQWDDSPHSYYYNPTKKIVHIGAEPYIHHADLARNIDDNGFHEAGLYQPAVDDHQPFYADNVQETTGLFGNISEWTKTNSPLLEGQRKWQVVAESHGFSGGRVWIGNPGETFMNLAEGELGYTMEQVWQRLPEHDFSAGSYDPTQARVYPQDEISSVQEETIRRNLR